LPNLSAGVFKIAPMSATAKTTLGNLQAAMAASPPKHATFDAGWGSIEDDPTWLRRANFDPPVHPSHVISGFRGYTDVLAGRLYWFKKDASSRLWFDNPTEAQKHSLHAVDVLIHQRAVGQFTILVTSRDVRDQNAYIVPALRSLFTAADTASIVSADASPLTFPGRHDFFLWLIHQALRNPEVTPELTIEDLREARTQDKRFRGTSFTNGIDSDRREVMSLLMNPESKFGPAKMLLREDDLEADFDVELFVDGGFALTQKGTEYDDEDLDRHKRLYSVLDVAHHIIPELSAAYTAYRNWPTEKVAFRRDCFAVASAPLSGGFNDIV
jgi:hypothetical protein